MVPDGYQTLKTVEGERQFAPTAKCILTSFWASFLCRTSCSVGDIPVTVSTAESVLDLFRRLGALLEGHFRLTSGLHSPGYLQCAVVLQHPKEAARCGALLADAVLNRGVQVVLSPALGGIVIGQEVARALGVRSIFAERQDGKLTLRRGFTLAPGERVLVVEDVVTTGGSTRETIEVARAAGAIVVGAAAIIDRSGSGQAGPGLDVPFHALATVSLPTYQPESCPLCAAGSPVIKPGSRA
jgi:orotate phosphoribosyltransferase